MFNGLFLTFEGKVCLIILDQRFNFWLVWFVRFGGEGCSKEDESSVDVSVLLLESSCF